MQYFAINCSRHAVLQVSGTHSSYTLPSVPFLLSFLFPQNEILYSVFYSFIYLWLHWVFAATCRLSLVAVQALGTWASLVAAQGLVACGSRALECAGFSNCGMWAQLLLSTQNLPNQGSNPCPLHWQVDSYLKFLAILIGKKNQNKTHFTLAFSLLAIRLNIFSFLLTVCISSVNFFSSFPFICSCVSITQLF